MIAVTLLALGACDIPLEDEKNNTNSGGGDGGSGDGDGGPVVTATVIANTQMTASIIDNFSGTHANDAHASLAQGTDLTNKSLTASNSLGDSATGAFRLETTGGSVVFKIQDDAVSTGIAMIAGVGKNHTPNNHQTLLRLISSEPVTGLLTVTLDGHASGSAGSGFTTIDIGNDSDPDYQTPNLQGTYQETLTFDSTFEVRTETVTQVENDNFISRSITLTFVPSDTSDLGSGGGGSAPFAATSPLEALHGLGVDGGSNTQRSKTISVPLPPPGGSSEGVELEDLSVRGDQAVGVPPPFWADECQTVEDPSLDCDGDLFLDSCQLLRDPSLDCDGDRVIDSCQITGDASLDQNGNGVLDSCEAAFENYCQAAWNSSGGPAVMGARGTASLTANDLTLTVAGAPPGQFGHFFYGGDENLLVVGDGAVCVRSPLNRIYPVLTTDSSGKGSLALDLGSPPFSNGCGRVAPFETWHFQFWFRDRTSGGAGYNFSDGLSVTFYP